MPLEEATAALNGDQGGMPLIDDRPASHETPASLAGNIVPTVAGIDGADVAPETTDSRTAGPISCDCLPLVQTLGIESRPDGARPHFIASHRESSVVRTQVGARPARRRAWIEKPRTTQVKCRRHSTDAKPMKRNHEDDALSRRDDYERRTHRRDVGYRDERRRDEYERRTQRPHRREDDYREQRRLRAAISE